jgi:hypothetical protein
VRSVRSSVACDQYLTLKKPLASQCLLLQTLLKRYVLVQLVLHCSMSVSVYILGVCIGNSRAYCFHGIYVCSARWSEPLLVCMQAQLVPIPCCLQWELYAVVHDQIYYCYFMFTMYIYNAVFLYDVTMHALCTDDTGLQESRAPADGIKLQQNTNAANTT